MSLLVTDFSLSGSLTGLDLAQSTRGRMPHVDVVIISGRPELIAQDDFAFVAKPCMAADILRAVTPLGHDNIRVPNLSGRFC